MSNTPEVQKQNVKSLFEFVREFSVLRSRVITHIRNEHWHKSFSAISGTPGVQVRSRLEAGSNDSNFNEIFRIEFLNDVEPITAPNLLVPWLLPGWQNGLEEPRVRQSLEPSVNGEHLQEDAGEKFEDDPERVQVFGTWLQSWHVWQKRLREVRANHALFHELLLQYQQLEANNYRTMMALGCLTVISDDDHENANHPVVYQRVRLVRAETKGQDDVRPVISLLLDENEKPVFDTELLASTHGEFDLSRASVIADYLSGSEFDPLCLSEEFRNAFKSFVATSSIDARFISDKREAGRFTQSVSYHFLEDLVLFVKNRPTGMKQAVDQIVRAIDDNSVSVPKHLLGIICGQSDPLPPIDYTEPTLEDSLAAVGGEDPQILMAKPSNREQLRIAQELERHDGVLVQGPPGTGKTHTIANLLGHFLSQGKSVLVSSQTSQALTVLKSKLPEPIQPLCVSLTDDKGDLEATISQLSSRLEEIQPTRLKNEIRSMEVQRSDLQARLLDTRKKLAAIRFDELKTIVHEGRSYTLKELAVWLRENEHLSQVIPDTAKLNECLPFDWDCLREMYELRSQLQCYEIKEFQFLSELEGLRDPRQVKLDVVRLKQLSQDEGGIQAQATRNILEDVVECSLQGRQLQLPASLLESDIEALEELVGALKQTEPNGKAELYLRVQGQDSECARPVWTKLLQLAQDSYEKTMAALTQAVGDEVVFAPNSDIGRIQESLEFFITKGLNGQPSFLQRAFNKAHCENLKLVSINGSVPSNPQQLELAMCFVRSAQARERFFSFWKRNLKGELSSLIDFVDEVGFHRSYRERFIKAFDWYSEVVCPLLEKLTSFGLTSKDLFQCELAHILDPNERYQVIVKNLTEFVIPCLDAYLRNYRIDVVANRVKTDHTVLKELMDRGSVIARQLLISIDRDDTTYMDDAKEIQRLKGLSIQISRFKELFQTLEVSYPMWAEAVLHSTEHRTVPVNLMAAWNWRCLNSKFNEYLNVNYDELQSNAVRCSQQLRELTADLVAKRAWFRLYERIQTRPKILSDLRLWRYYMSKIGKGTGKRAEMWRQQAKELMPQCQPAVPIWIMPLERAITNFNVTDTFDVVIVDEASQADLTALPILFLGKKIVVVGDDRQVSPMSIGVKQEMFETLKNRYLIHKVVSPQQYQPNTSLYDIAQVAFTPLMLKEHFRCVPKIIGFSNQLSYNNEIKPLRPAASTELLPAMIPYRVDGVRSYRDTNEVEAETIVRLIKACVVQPEYKGKSFGIVVMRSGSSGRGGQVGLINSKIGQLFTPDEIDLYKLRCGLSGDFQGDERDVIFLSLVDSCPDGEVLRLEGDGVDDAMKKRYNVAVSRAKDQLWIIHSFDPDEQLKHADLRRRLIAYAREDLDARQEEIETKADSVFEVRVAKALAEYGYGQHQIQQQYQVGSYFIDMVISQGLNRVAIECDGERYHSSPQQIQYDMERQTILERNGWKFIRVRGGEFFRNPGLAMDRIFRELHDHNIYPESKAGVNQVQGDLYRRVMEELEKINIKSPLLVSGLCEDVAMFEDVELMIG